MPYPFPDAAGAAGARNMALLIQLRWVAMAGQVSTILVVAVAMGVRLPLAAMLAVVGAVLFLNLGSTALLRRGRARSNAALFSALILDVVSLTALLYLSGGATNPFVSLYLLQVVLGAVLLDTWSTLAIVGLTSGCFALLAWRYRPIDLPAKLADRLSALNVAGAWICFVLIATLLVLLVTRITANLNARDAHLADLRQHAAEEDHIVRMGLLASGAAHELGTPLSTLAVILGDWQRTPALDASPELRADLAEMQTALARCKAIVTGVLLAAGEARGEASAPTTLQAFLGGLVEQWRAAHLGRSLRFDDEVGADLAIVGDTALGQVISNVLDNAAEASADRVGLTARRVGADLMLTVRDDGPGFTPEQLAALGKPYASSKGRTAGGLGLFLVVNVMRKLGGAAEAANGDGRSEWGRGAIVTLRLPLAVLALGEDKGDG